jgi:hypothetical protein
MDSHHTYRLDLECMLIPTVEMEIITSSNRAIETKWVEILFKGAFLYSYTFRETFML